MKVGQKIKNQISLQVNKNLLKRRKRQYKDCLISIQKSTKINLAFQTPTSQKSNQYKKNLKNLRKLKALKMMMNLSQKMRKKKKSLS